MIFTAALTLGLALAQTLPAQPPISPDSYADSATRDLVERARNARDRNERLVTGYRATVSQRLGVGIRALSRDRMLFRQELVAAIDWKRDAKSTVTVVGARQGIPIALKGDQVPEELDEMARSLVINPAEDYLRVAGINDDDDDGFVYPLREGGERDYRFAIGDSTVITLPSGKRIRLRELVISARRSDWKLLTGSLWFDLDTYGLVRAVFRPARPFEMRRDLAKEDLEDVPGWVNAGGEVKYVTLEYGFYEDRWWMLRYVAIDAIGSMGSWLGIPFRLEHVYSDYEVEGGSSPDPASTFRPAGTVSRWRDDSAGRPRSAADSARRKAVADSIDRAVEACIDQARREGRERRDDRADRGRRIRAAIRLCTRRTQEDSVLAVVVPDDTVALITHPSLGPPILEMGDLISESELKGLADAIKGLPNLSLGTRLVVPTRVTALLERLRYNRVEGLSVAVPGRLELGRFTLDGTARFGVADGRLNGEAGITRSGLDARWRLGAYRRLVAANPETKPFGIVNSFFAFVSHRDEGQYFRGDGIELTGRNAASGWWSWRLYAERQSAARVETDFGLSHVFGGDGVFGPNIRADSADLLGASLALRGSKPVSRAVTLGGDLALDAATGDFDYGRAAVGLRAVIAPGGPVAGALGLTAGTSTGTIPIQGQFFLGGPATLRGYDGGVIAGASFWAARAEIANSFPAARVSVFTDLGWAGSRADFARGRPLHSVGVGGSFLDGLIRLDLARAVRSPTGWRFYFYFDGIL
jgi:hypothetical protein